MKKVRVALVTAAAAPAASSNKKKKTARMGEMVEERQWQRESPVLLAVQVSTSLT